MHKLSTWLATQISLTTSATPRSGKREFSLPEGRAPPFRSPAAPPLIPHQRPHVCTDTSREPCHIVTALQH